MMMIMMIMMSMKISMGTKSTKDVGRGFTLTKEKGFYGSGSFLQRKEVESLVMIWGRFYYPYLK